MPPAEMAASTGARISARMAGTCRSTSESVGAAPGSVTYTLLPLILQGRDRWRRRGSPRCGDRRAPPPDAEPTVGPAEVHAAGVRVTSSRTKDVCSCEPSTPVKVIAVLPDPEIVRDFWTYPEVALRFE